MRRVLLGVAVVVLLAGAGGALAYRQTGPRLEGGGDGTALQVGVGQLIHAIYPIRSQAGVRIDDVDVAGAPDLDARIWVYRPGGGTHLGSYPRHSHEPAAVFKPAVGQWIGDDDVDLVVTFVAERQGTYRTRELRVTYGSGLRRRTTRLPFQTCFTAVPPGTSRTSAEPCDPSAGEGTFFDL